MLANIFNGVINILIFLVPVPLLVWANQPARSQATPSLHVPPGIGKNS
jgi:hypothetical protein